MPIIGWIRDLFGIQKDMYETKKTRLEIEKIEDDKREKLITLATLDDVEKYDPKVQEIRAKISPRFQLDGIHIILKLVAKLPFKNPRRRRRRRIAAILIIALAALSLIFVISKIW